MPLDPHIIPPKPGDAGTASALADLVRRVSQLESKYGVVGAGARVTGPVIATADSGPRIVMQGSTEPGGAQLYCTDSTGTIVVQLVPGEGINLAAGSVGSSGDGTGAAITPNLIAWLSGGRAIGQIGGYQSGAIPFQGNVIIYATKSDGSVYGSLNIASTGAATASGSMNATAFNVVSEERLKCAIKNVRQEEHDALLRLRPISYRLRSDDSEHYGFLVDDVAEHLPAAVYTTEDPDADRGVNLSSLVALLTARVQTQDKRIKSLEEKA